MEAGSAEKRSFSSLSTCISTFIPETFTWYLSRLHAVKEAKNNRITKIEITDDMMFVNPDVRNELFKRVMEKQNTTVDAVSGGTVSCKAYLKSIENALNN